MVRHGRRTLLLDPTLKELFERPARHPDSGYTFPSGSATLALVVLLALLATVPAGRRWPIACLGAVFVVVQGIALVAAGWHYPSDVLAGWCAATAWAALVWLVASTRLRESALTDGSAQAGTR